MALKGADVGLTSKESAEFLNIMKAMHPKKPDWYEELYARILNANTKSYDEIVGSYKLELFNQLDGSVKRVLELGVGTGPNFKYFADRKDITVLGVDPNKKMEKYARAAASAAGLSDSQFEFIHAVGEGIPVPTSSVDAVISTLVLCSVKDISSTLREVQRVLKPGGYFVFVEHVVAQEGSVLRFFQRLLNPLQVFVSDGCHFTRDTLSCLQNAKFESVDARSIMGAMHAFVPWHLGFEHPFLLRGTQMEYASCIETVEQTLVVVGGGAAGVYGAIRAKSVCPKLQVLVLEKGELLSKVKISGGGRCNVTTGRFTDPLPLSEQYPRGHKELRGSYFRVHGPRETAAWFEEHGVYLKTEEDGRMFPVTNDSATVVSCLLNEARRVGVSLQTRVVVKDILSTNGRFNIQIKRKNEAAMNDMQADYVLLATGSALQGYDLAAKLGHTVVRPMPSLFTFKVSDPMLNQLAGVSFDNVRVELEIINHKLRSPNFNQVGPLLVTHWGLSGPAILRLSAWAARELFTADYKGILWVDFVPNLTIDEVKEILARQKLLCPRRKLDSGAPHAIGMVRRFWQYLINRQNLNVEALWCEMSNRTLNELAALVKKCSFQISGKGEFKDEFVTAGGLPLDEVNLKTMESRKCSRLYIAGELLNVDGITGGFNFQNAWTGGYLAGSTIAFEALHVC